MVRPTESVLAHERADTDSSVWAIHHTLGKSANQAAPGNHNHPEYEGGGGGSGEAWFLGSGAPAGALGETGDLYLNTDNGDYYEKTGSTTWTLRGNLTGPQGEQGDQGPVGPPGTPSSSYSAVWRWTTTIPLISGRLTTNTADFATATQILIYEITDGGGDASNFFGKLRIGNEIYVQERDNASNWARYVISSTPTDNGTYWTIPVTLDNAAGVAPTTNAQIDVSFIIEGSQTEEWISGEGVPAGTTGKLGDWYLDELNGDVYEKTGDTTWTLRTNIRGPAGQDASSENVLTNPSFEQWDTGASKPVKWGTFWASTPRGTITQADGRDVKSAKWTPASTPGTNGYQRYGTEDPFPIVPGEKWYFSVWARAEDAANPPNLILDVLTAPHDNPDFFVEGTTIRNVISSVSVATTAWVLYEGTLTIPAGEIYARMVISLNSSDGSALRIGYLDQAVAKSLTPSPESLVPYPTYNALAGTTGTTTPATPLFGFPIPEFTDAPDVPTDLSDLANAIETIIDRMCPPGVVKFYTGTTEPTGWLFCNGQAISRTTYPRLNALAAAVSYASPWGAGDGSTTFNVPDANRRLIRGVGSGSALGSNDSQTEANRTLQHTHPISLGGAHNHGINATNHTGAGNTTTGGTANRVINIAGAVDGSHNHGGNTDQSITHDHGGATGQNTGTQNIPHITMNVIIKT